MKKSSFFPMFIDLSGKKIAVVGGGKIALRRIRTLLQFGGKLTVVSPEALPELEALAEEGRIVWMREAYRRELILSLIHI